MAQDNTLAFDLQLFAEEAVETPAESTDTKGTETTEQADNAAATAEDGTQPGGDGKPPKASGGEDLLADYNPTLPEGFTVNDELMKEFIPAAKELGLNPEQADKLVGIGSKVAQVTAEKVIADIKQQCENGYSGFLETMKGSEKDIGNANALIEHYGGKEAKEGLHAAMTALSGFAPDSVKPFFNALLKMGKDFADPEMHLGQPAPQEAERYPGAPQGLKFR